MDIKPKQLPVGIQTYQKIVEGNYLYVDKTEYVYRMTHLSNYVFLSRPRRFGKSLLVSTLQSYFEGRKELFKGLAIEQLEKDWIQYPVLRFDMSTAKHCSKEELEQELSSKLTAYEAIYGNGVADDIKPNLRLKSLIENAHDKTGQKVVILIDEYDAPLLDVAHEDSQLSILREVMRNFYSPLKACDPYLKFVFLTGITKFSQLSIFSELNNLKNISMMPEFAAICGITAEEMQTQMSDHIDDIATHLGMTRDETTSKLRQQYDGYHFTWPSPDVFNPFSLLNAFQDHALNSYWFASGTPTYLIEMLRQFDILPSEIGGLESTVTEFDAPTENMVTIVPLLYQSGYVTIKGYDPSTELYTLDIPNREVRIGLMNSLLPLYATRMSGRGMTTAAKMSLALRNDNIDDALSLLQSFLLTVPYCENTRTEGHYQQMLYIILSLLTQYDQLDVEVRTPTRRVDMVMRTRKALYLIELKMNKSADIALRQIDLKDYPSRFARCTLPIVKVGINFDSERHTISDWKITANDQAIANS